MGGVHPSMKWVGGVYTSNQWGRGCGRHPWAHTLSPGQTRTPRETANEVGSTHPTGMHSCVIYFCGIWGGNLLCSPLPRFATRSTTISGGSTFRRAPFPGPFFFTSVFWKIWHPLWGWCPLWEILDPLLVTLPWTYPVTLGLVVDVSSGSE